MFLERSNQISPGGAFSYPVFPTRRKRLNMPKNRQNSTIQLRILETAAELFSRHGYRGTTTRDVALLAGTSENSLFRHFQTKEDLFWAVLEVRLSRAEMRQELKDALRERQDPARVLPQLMEFITYIVIYQEPVLRLLTVAFLEMPEKAELMTVKYLTPMLNDISGYLAECTGRGSLSGFEAALLTGAALSAPLAHQVCYRLSAAGNAEPLPGAKARARTYAQFWLSMLNAQAASVPSVPDDRRVNVQS